MSLLLALLAVYAVTGLGTALGVRSAANKQGSPLGTDLGGLALLAVAWPYTLWVIFDTINNKQNVL